MVSECASRVARPVQPLLLPVGCAWSDHLYDARVELVSNIATEGSCAEKCN